MNVLFSISHVKIKKVHNTKFLKVYLNSLYDPLCMIDKKSCFLKAHTYFTFQDIYHEILFVLKAIRDLSCYFCHLS